MTLSRVQWFILALVGYLLPMGYALAAMDYLLALVLVVIPFGIGLGYMALVQFDRFLPFMTGLVPISIVIKDLGNGYGISFPGEILLGISALILGMNFLRSPQIDRRIVFHPVSIMILAQCVWIFITTTTSDYTEISFKFFVSRIAYLLVFYIGMLLIFRDFSKIKSFIWAYVLGLTPVMLYSILHLSSYGLSRRYSPEMAEPFFDDHTVFGACIAMVLPVMWIMWWNRKQLMFDLSGKSLAGVALMLMAIALAVSFSRAAWMSVAAAIAFSFVLRLRIPFWVILSGTLTVGIVGYVNQDTLFDRFSANENASGEDVLETAKSITNVSTDESNKERLNRWSCALEMYRERPWFGFGPGTYERSYGIYQVYFERTRISTNEGDRGDAHSEYLTALSEQGLPGFFIHISLLATIFWTGMRVAYRGNSQAVRLIGAGLVLGFLTYLIHGGVNSFLDLDKAAALIWGIAALLVGLDIYHLKKSESELSPENSPS